MLVRGEVLLVDDSKGVQELQVKMLQGEVRDRIPSMQPYGFTSRPHPGAEAGLACMGGLREQAFAFNVGDRRWRVRNLQTGEVALYTDEGDRIVLGREGEIKITAGTTVEITAPLVRIDGDLNVTGEITDRADSNSVSMTQIRQVYNNHRHLERNINAGPTDPPDTTLDN